MKVIVSILILTFVLTGCSSSVRDDGSSISPEAKLSGKVRGEAYLFDAKLRRNKKPTSVRLEFYQTDSVIAISGRGYLGKGALKGRLTPDSLEVYFPTTDEYLFESVADVMASFDCSDELPPIDLMALFGNLPDSVLDASRVSIVSDFSNKRYPEYQISIDGCLWEMNLTYVRQKMGWRVKKFSFSDGKGSTLKGTRRNYKRDVNIKAKKFAVPVKPGSVRIIL